MFAQNQVYQEHEGVLDKAQFRGGIPKEEYLERVRTYRDTEPYRKAIRKRAVWVEPLFGEAKDWHGLRRFRLRRLEKVNAEALLKAAGQNVKRLLAFGTRGPKGSAQAVALRQL